MGWRSGARIPAEHLADIGAQLAPQNLAPHIVWDIPRVAASYTTSIGAVASACIVSSVFIANLTVARQSSAYASAIGMFIIAFTILIGTGIMFNAIPNRTDVADETFLLCQRYAFFLANLGFFLAIMMSWGALKLLLLAIDLEYPALIFTWVLLFAAVAGSLNLGQYLTRLTNMPLKTGWTMPVVAFGVAAFYRLVVGPSVTGLLPTHDEPLLTSAAVFFVAGSMFVLHSGVVLAASGDERLRRLLVDHGERMQLAIGQAIITAVALLFLVVAVT